MLLRVPCTTYCLSGPVGPEDSAQPWPYDPAIGDIMYKHVFVDPVLEAQPGFSPPAAAMTEEVRVRVWMWVQVWVWLLVLM